jgi:hypothetical protein
MNRIFLAVFVAILLTVFAVGVIFTNVALINNAGTFGMVAVPFVIFLAAYIIVYSIKKFLAFLTKPVKA